MKMSMGYPNAAEEARIIGARHGVNPMETVEAVATPEEIVAMQKTVERIHVDPAVLNYIVELVCATRKNAMVALAASPRASLALMRAACANAMLDGRTYVIPKDVSDLYQAIVSHRIMLAPEARIERMTAEQLSATLKESVKAPIVKK